MIEESEFRGFERDAKLFLPRVAEGLCLVLSYWDDTQWPAREFAAAASDKNVCFIYTAPLDQEREIDIIMFAF